MLLSVWAAAAIGMASSAFGEIHYPRYGCGKGFEDLPFCNSRLPIADRVDDLVQRLRLEEKPLLMVARLAPLGNISRLGIPQYDWGANCIHGVQSRCGKGSDGKVRCPTSFGAPNLLGATFNESAWWTMGHIIGVELRSLWKQGRGENHPPTQLPPLGLDCWSPNINIVRDPRWGRNMETTSEDPLILSRFGIQVTKGLQEGKEDKGRLQAIVTLKHFAANELEGTWKGPGGPAEYPGTGMCPGRKCTRHTINVNISSYDLASSYLASFRSTVVEGGALGVMCSYNSINGYPSCANKWLLNEKLRQDWGFKGYVTGDSGAVADIYDQHWFAPSMEDAVAKAVEAGTDVQSSGWPSGHPWATTNAEYLKYIPDLVRQGKLSEEALDEALRHTLTLRFRLGLFDDPASQPYEHFSPDIVRSSEHLAAALDSTEQGLVLLKNEKGTLPIPEGRKIAVIGPHAASRGELLGNYLGQICPGERQSFACVQTIFEALANLTQQVTTAPGLPGISSEVDPKILAEAVATAKAAEYIILALGLDTASIEKEGQDRRTVMLPPGQLVLLDAMIALKRPLTVVLVNGGMVAMTPVKEKADAIVEAWYPGFFGATAIARAVLGHSNRWGKLPVTIYDEHFTEQFDMLSFDMTKSPGRTYRYFTGQPLWPFGYGLSYTTFALQILGSSSIKVSQAGGSAKVDVLVLNTGERAGDEVVMAYFSPVEGTLPAGCAATLLRKELFAFQRVALQPQTSATLSFTLTAASFQVFTDAGDGVSYAGKYTVLLSTGSVDVTINVEVEGNRQQPLVLQPWQAPAKTTSIVV